MLGTMKAHVEASGATISEALDRAREFAAQGFGVEPTQIRCIAAQANSEIEETRDSMNRVIGATVRWRVSGMFDAPGCREEVSNGEDVE